MTNVTVSTIHGTVRLSEAETTAYAALQDGHAVRPAGERPAPGDTTPRATMGTMLSLVALRLARWEHGGIVATLAPPAQTPPGMPGPLPEPVDECASCDEDLNPGYLFTLCPACRAEVSA